MAKILITSREGEERQVEVDLATRPTLMETIRNDGSFDLEALCGGMLSCSTCHVFIAPAWQDKLPPACEEEVELISGLSSARASSRLSCQIQLDASLDGLHVTVAPKD